MSISNKLLAQEELADPVQQIVLTTNLSLFQVYRFPQGIHICNFVFALPVALSAGCVYIQLLLGTKF